MVSQETVSYVGNIAFLWCHPLYIGLLVQWKCTTEGTWNGSMPTCIGESLYMYVEVCSLSEAEVICLILFMICRPKAV